MSEFDLTGTFRPQIKKALAEDMPYVWRSLGNHFPGLWAIVFVKPLGEYFQIAA